MELIYFSYLAVTVFYFIYSMKKLSSDEKTLNGLEPVFYSVRDMYDDPDKAQRVFTVLVLIAIFLFSFLWPILILIRIINKITKT